MIGDVTLSSNGDGWNRRRLLMIAGTVTGVTLAGCSSVTSQTFAASPVILPDSDQTEMRLAETDRDSRTTMLSGPSDSEIEITNQAVVHRRANGIGGQ